MFNSQAYQPCGLDSLGADEPAQPKSKDNYAPEMLIWLGGAVAGACIGDVFWGGNLKRVVLSGLSGGVVASRIRALAKKEETWDEALRRLTSHAVGTTGAVLADSHPVVAYLAGSIGTRIVIDRKYRKTWARIDGPRDAPQKVEMIDVTPMDGR